VKIVENPFLVTSKEIGLEVNVDKPKHMVMSRDQNTGWSHKIKNDNSSFEMVEQFRYLETTLTNQNSAKLRADWIRRIFAVIRCRIFCLPI
jgi:hypothetical protein